MTLNCTLNIANKIFLVLTISRSTNIECRQRWNSIFFFHLLNPTEMKGSSKFYLWGEERGGESSVRVGLVCFNFTWKLYYLVYNIQNHWRMGALNLVWCRNFYLFPCVENSLLLTKTGGNRIESKRESSGPAISLICFKSRSTLQGCWRLFLSGHQIWSVSISQYSTGV